MPQFGGYRTVQERSQTGFAVIYTACRGEEAAEAFAVKVFRPSVYVGKSEGAERQTRAFAESVAVHRQAAAEDASCWAPIHAQGLTAEEAFYVTDLCRSSLRHVIDARLDVTAADLRNIVTSIARGLIALKKACRRPHGNLKAGNVLIPSAAALSQTRVVLCDPLPSEYVDPDTHWTDDLREVAEFIHQLVMHQPTPATKGWQVPESPEWDRLGKQADTWRNLCNRLLSLDTRPDAITLEDLLEELNRLPAPRQSATRPLLAVGAGLVVLFAGLWTLWHWLRPAPSPVPEKYTAWAEVIVWVAPLIDELGDSEARWRTHSNHLGDLYKPTIRPIYEPFRKKFDDFDDEKLFRWIRDYVSSNGVRPDEQKERAVAYEMLGEASADTVYQAVGQFKAFFFSDANGPDGWPWLKELRTAAASADPNLAPCRTHLEPILAKIPSSQEVASERLALDSDAPKRLAEAVKEIVAIRPVLQRVRADFNDVKARQAEAREAVRKVQNDRSARPQDVRTRIDDLAAEMEGIDGRIRALSQLPPYASMGDYAGALHERTGQILKLLDGIGPKAFDLLEKPTKWRDDRMRENEIADAEEVINQEWLRRRTYWLGAANGSPGGAGYGADTFTQWEREFGRSDNGAIRETYYAIKQKVEDTRKNLMRLCEEVPAGPPWGSDTADAPWRAELAKLFGDYRRRVLAAIIVAVRADRTYDDMFPDPTLAVCQTRIDAFIKSWCTDIGDLSADYTRIHGILTSFRDFSELSGRIPGKDKSIAELDKHWRAVSAVWDPNVEAALSDLGVAAHLLSQIQDASGQDAVALATTLSGQAPTNYRAALLCAAWWRLGDSPDWPSTPAQWNAEQGIERELAGLDVVRTGPLNAQFAGESLERHRAAISKCSGECIRLSPTADRSSHETLVAFVTGNDWQQGKYDMEAFYSPAEHGGRFVRGAELTADRAKEWLAEVENYRRLEADPRRSAEWAVAIQDLTNRISRLESNRRDSQGWEGVIERLTGCVTEGLKAPPDPSARQGLEEARQTLTGYDAQLRDIAQKPAVVKYDQDMSRGLKILKDELPALTVKIAGYIKPLEYRLLDKDKENADKYLVFTEDSGLSGFVPMDPDAPPDGRGLRRMAAEANWRDLDKRSSFASVTLKGEPGPARLPNYIQAKTDPNVALHLIPGSGAVPAFYMALHEITNRQYATFLTKNGATGGQLGMPIRGGAKREAWISRHTTTEDLDLGYLRIRNNNGQFEVAEAVADYPAVWIMCRGAQAYAEWLDPKAQLPRVSWHRHALPGNDRTNWHVRGQRWSAAAETWNSYLERFRTVGGAVGQSPPLGAADQSYCDDATNEEKLKTLKPIDPNEIVDRDEKSTTHLPRPVGADDRTKLSDLLGNVWEWCATDDGGFALCGGSCLSAPDDVGRDEALQYPADRSNRDVGFRVVVVPLTP